MTPQQAFADYVVEQMQAFGPVQARCMFGGRGVFRDGLMFALIINGQLYLKADELSKPAFAAQGLTPFTYLAQGQTRSLNYYTAPAEVFDSPDALLSWTRTAYACAVRHNPGAPEKKPRGKRPRVK